jgi:hypothetical protein
MSRGIMSKIGFATVALAALLLTSCEAPDNGPENAMGRAKGFVEGMGWKPTQVEVLAEGKPCAKAEYGVLVREEKAPIDRVALVCVPQASYTVTTDGGVPVPRAVQFSVPANVAPAPPEPAPAEVSK